MLKPNKSLQTTHNNKPKTRQDNILQTEMQDTIINTGDTIFIVPQCTYAKTENDSTFLESYLNREKVIIKNSFAEQTGGIEKTMLAKNMAFQDNSWITITLLSLFILITLIKSIFYKRFILLINVFLSSRVFNLFARESNFFKESIAIIIFPAFIVSSSLFLYQFISHSEIITIKNLNDVSLFATIIILLSSFYLSKALIRLTLGALFKTQTETYEHHLNIFIFDFISSFIIIPITIVLTYNPIPIFYYIGAGVFIAIFVYKLIRLLNIGINKAKFSGYYLFLYLCGVEILPVLVVGKLLLINTTY